MIIERLSDETRFTATEKKVIEFIQEHPRVVTNLSLDDLAAACFTSQASIIRLCKKLGTKGFAEFKVQLASELSLFAQDNREISVDIPIEPDSNSQEIAKTFYNLSSAPSNPPGTRSTTSPCKKPPACWLTLTSSMFTDAGNRSSLPRTSTTSSSASG